MRSNFVNKVYDTYIASDFDYGDDNLNPIREIDLSNAKSIDDKIAEIYAELNKRVEKVKKTVSEITGSTETEVFRGNTVSESNNDTDDSHKKNVINLTGGTGDKIVVVPSFSTETDPITLELELMLLEKTLQAYYPDPEQTGGNVSTGNTGLTALEIPPFDTDCTIILGANTSNQNQIMDVDFESDLGGNKDGLSGQGSGSNNKSASLDSNTVTVDASKLADAMDDALLAAEKASQANDKDQASCAKAEIGILKMILAILKVIKTIRQIMDPAFTLIMQAIKIVQLAAQCWNNPTCIGVIIQRVLGTVIAILMGVVAELLAQIWKMLGMDCFTEEVKSVMDAIREALAAISGITSQLNPTGIILDVKEAIGSVEDTYDLVSDSLSDLTANMNSIKETSKKSLRTMLDAKFPGLSDEQFSSFISNKRYRERLLDTLAKTSPESVDSIRSAVNDVLTLPDTVMDSYDKIQKLIGNLSNEKQLMATLENLEKF